MFYHLTVIYTCWLVCLKFLLREMQAFCHMVQPCNGTISIVHEGRASTSPSWVSFVTHINGYLDHMHCRGCLVFNCWGCGSSFVILFAPWYLAEHRESIWSISLKFDAVCFWTWIAMLITFAIVQFNAGEHAYFHFLEESLFPGWLVHSSVTTCNHPRQLRYVHVVCWAKYIKHYSWTFLYWKLSSTKSFWV